MGEYKRLTIKDSKKLSLLCDNCNAPKDGYTNECDGDCYAEMYARLEEFEDKIESGLLVELPCKVGDMVYGVDYTECQSKYATTEKEKRKIFNVCMTMSGSCDKCKYSIPAVHKFVCTHSEGEEPYRRVVVTLKEGVKLDNNYGNRNKGRYNRNYNKKKER